MAVALIVMCNAANTRTISNKQQNFNYILVNVLLIILSLFFFSSNSLCQFNEDHYEIKKRKVKSITDHEVKYVFDENRKLIEYWVGDIDEKLEESNIPYGQLFQFKIDTIGRFTKLVGLNFTRCEDSTCLGDTIAYQYWNYTGTELDSSFGWKYTDYYIESSLESSKYLLERHGDTLVQKYFDYPGNNIPSEIQIQFIINLTPKRRCFFQTEIPIQYLYSDSALFFLDSIHFGSRILVDYNKRWEIKKVVSLNDKGDITRTCYRFKEQEKNYSCTCRTKYEKRKSSFPIGYPIPLSKKVRLEQWNKNKHSTTPSLLLDQNLKIEYY